MASARGSSITMSERRGVALISVLLLLLAATGLAHGALLLARAEWMGSDARARTAGEATVATATLDESLQRGFPPGLSGEPIWTRRVLEVRSPNGGAVSVHRLGAESWWLEYVADGLVDRRTGVPGWLVWWMDPLARVQSFGAVISVGRDAPWIFSGTLDRTGFGQVPAGLDPTTCGFGAHGVSELPDVVASLPESTEPPRLGLLPFDTLMARTEVTLEGMGSPGPREELGACAVDDAWNWGDPERLEAACGRLVAVRAAGSGLSLDGGVGQAALIVDGDVELSGDARLYGFVITSGVLRLRDQSELHGVAVASGGVLVDAGARVQGSACWAARALLAARTQWMPRPSRIPGLPPIGP